MRQRNPILRRRYGLAGSYSLKMIVPMRSPLNHRISPVARRHAQLEADGVDVSTSRPASGGYKHFVLIFNIRDFLYDRREGLDTAVAE